MTWGIYPTQYAVKKPTTASLRTLVHITDYQLVRRNLINFISVYIFSSSNDDGQMRVFLTTRNGRSNYERHVTRTRWFITKYIWWFD